MRRYDAHGYAVESMVDLALPASGNSPTTGALTLRRGEPRPVPREPAAGELLALLETGVETHYAVSRCDDGLALRFGGCVEFVADAGLRQVTFHVQPGQDEGYVGVLASGSLLAVRLLLDGQLVLHASALDTGGQVVAFCGGPGMGKSTLAALLSQAGMPLVTDDVLRVGFGAGRPTVWPGATESRLRRSADHVADAASPSAVRDTADGRRAVSAPRLCDGPLPLAAVVVPMPTRELAKPEVRRLGKVEALMSLVRFPRVIGWCEPHTSQQQFQLLGELVEKVPVAEVRIPWGPPFAPDLAAWLGVTVDDLAPIRRL